MLVRLVQSLNALLSILVTLFGMVMLVRLVQFSNTLLPMLVIPLQIFTHFISSVYEDQGL